MQFAGFADTASFSWFLPDDLLAGDLNEPAPLDLSVLTQLLCCFIEDDDTMPRCFPLVINGEGKPRSWGLVLDGEPRVSTEPAG